MFVNIDNIDLLDLFFYRFFSCEIMKDFRYFLCHFIIQSIILRVKFLYKSLKKVFEWFFSRCAWECSIFFIMWQKMIDRGSINLIFQIFLDISWYIYIYIYVYMYNYIGYRLWLQFSGVRGQHAAESWILSFNPTGMTNLHI